MRIAILSFVALATLASCKPKLEKLPSGYEYILHTNNTKGEMPQPTYTAYFHFSSSNDQGVVQSSYGEPQMPSAFIPTAAEMKDQPNPVIEALTKMHIGDSLTIIVPLDTIAQKPPGFENSKFLYYSIALKDVKTPQQQEEELQKMQMASAKIEGDVKKNIEAYKKGTLKDLKTTASGLKYVIHQEGKGAKPQTGDGVSVHYFGALIQDGTRFDDSFSRGTPLQFPVGVGQVIPGWDEGLQLLTPGTKATFFIPAKLGYGAAGSPPVIPADADLAFYVELVGFQKGSPQGGQR